MACSNIQFVQRMDASGKHKLQGIYDARPCRWCTSCRIDKRNYWEDRLDFAHLVHKSAAFVTFTYDDYRIPLNYAGVPTLRRADLSKFIDRLHSHFAYHGYSGFNFPDWKYYAVGEYGGQFGRPH